jgi:uncharacterized membrane protein
MSNKNHSVIIAYFDSVEAASHAAALLKDWDKANDAVKLGGVGLLHWEDGKMKTKKVGTRAAGKGAAWGAALGVTLAILSGGATLIGGALIGVTAGAVTGALFHKGIGLSDGDKVRLEDHLRNGGAALVAMADEDEVTMISEELARLGGTVENYQVPAEHEEQFDAAVDEAPANAEEAAGSEPASQAN